MSNGDLHSMELREKFASIKSDNKTEIGLQNNINKFDKTQKRNMLYAAIIVIYRKLIQVTKRYKDI